MKILDTVFPTLYKRKYMTVTSINNEGEKKTTNMKYSENVDTSTSEK